MKKVYALVFGKEVQSIFSTKELAETVMTDRKKYDGLSTVFIKEMEVYSIEDLDQYYA